MTFLTPFFLLAALAAAIPVVLHMMNRQKAKELPFSTLRFLRVSVQKTRRRRRVQDWLLMLLRAAALLLIALGLARPTVTSLGALLGGGANSAVAIILDNSASMGAVDSGKVRFETALGAVDQIMQELRDGDQVAMFLTGGPAFPEQGKLDVSRDGVMQMVSLCAQQGPSYERADLGIRIQQARKVLAESKAPNKQIYVVTDMQTAAWDGLKDDAPAATAGEEAADEQEDSRKIPVIVVNCHREPKPNVAVQKVEIEAAVPVAGLPIKGNVEIFNAANQAMQRRVELYLDDVKQESSPDLTVPPEGTASHSFQFVLQRGGLHRGEVRLVGDEGSKYDDRRFFSMEVDQGVPVAVVTAERHEIAYLDDSFYVQQALQPTKGGGWALRTSVLEAKDLATEHLPNFRVIYCVNLPTPDTDTADRLRKYVEGGGNVVWIAGSNVEPDAYNRMNEQAEKVLLPASLLNVRMADAAEGRDSWNVGFLDKKHPALQHLVEPASLYQSVLVYQHVRMDAGAQQGAWVMARLDDGEPLLVQRKFGRGSVTMLGTGAHVGWTNFPLRPIFLPLLARLTFDLAGLQQSSRTALAGTPLVLELEDEAQPVTVEIVPPSGTQNRLPTVVEPGQRGQVFRYVDTHDVGFYTVRPMEGANTKQVAFAVNVDPDEALPGAIDREELLKRFGQTPVVFADNPEDLSSTFKMLREGKSLWSLFLGLVLLVLIFETFISNWFSPKKQDEQVQKLTPIKKTSRRGLAVGRA